MKEAKPITLAGALALAEGFAAKTDEAFSYQLNNPEPPPLDDRAIVAELNRFATMVKTAKAAIVDQERTIKECERELAAIDRAYRTGRGGVGALDPVASGARRERARERVAKHQAAIGKAHFEASCLRHTSLDHALASALGIDVDAIEVDDRPISMNANMLVRLFNGKKVDLRQARLDRLSAAK